MKVVLDYTLRTGPVWRKGRLESEGKGLVGWRRPAVIAALARMPRHLWENGVRVNTRSQASIVGDEVGMFVAECLWGSRRRKRTILVGCRTLIAVGESMDPMREGAECLTVSECESRGVDMVVVVVVAAVEMAVLDWHM